MTVDTKSATRKIATRRGRSYTRLRLPEGKTTTTYLTPRPLIRALGPFDLDPATPNGRMPWKTARRRYTPKSDGLKSPWAGLVWLNPPFGRGIDAWLAKLDAHGNGLALVPDNTDTKWFQDHVFNARSVRAVFFTRGRLRFSNQEGVEMKGALVGGTALVAYGLEAERRLVNAIEAGELQGSLVKVVQAHGGAA